MRSFRAPVSSSRRLCEEAGYIPSIRSAGPEYSRSTRVAAHELDRQRVRVVARPVVLPKGALQACTRVVACWRHPRGQDAMEQLGEARLEAPMRPSGQR